MRKVRRITFAEREGSEDDADDAEDLKERDDIVES